MTEGKLYRFRSVDRLLNDNELDGQYIFFAGPSELNDPVEGAADMVWNGDEIVWSNLIRHYFKSLQMFVSLFLEAANYLRLDHQHVHVRRPFISRPYFDDRGQQRYEELCHTMFTKSNLNEVIAKLANRPVRRDELLVYLQIIHAATEPEIMNIWDAYVKTDEDKIPHIGKDHPMLKLSLDGDVSNTQVAGAFQLIRHMQMDRDFVRKVTTLRPSSCLEWNRNLLIMDLPSIYLRRIETLVHHEWYAACFCRSCDNSSLWGNYADGHRGVCLVFATERDESGEYLTLTESYPEFDSKSGSIISSTGKDSRFAVHQVDYDSQLVEIDFFRNISTIPRPEINEDWYSGPDGEVSSCASHLDSMNIEVWRTQLWDNYRKKIVRKTLDWQYEEECRLYLDDTFHNHEDPRYRRLRYGFESLREIVFGMNTPEADKISIADVIARKCKEQKHEVALRQAYLSRNSGKIVYL